MYYIPPIIIFLLSIALLATSTDVVPRSAGPLYCVLVLNTVLIFWLLHIVLLREGTKG